MKLLRSTTIWLLGTAALLPALPAWADTAPASAAAPAPGAAPAGTPAPATPARVPGGGEAATAPAAGSALQARQDNRRAFTDARLAALHAGLELTPGQAALWAPVESALRDLGTARHDAMRAWAEREDASPAERLKERSQHLIAMGQAIGRLADAAGPLVSSLTPAQRNRLPMLIHGLRPKPIVAQAFGLDRDDRDGERHDRWGERDRGGDRPGFGGRGEFGDRGPMERDRFDAWAGGAEGGGFAGDGRGPRPWMRREGDRAPFGRDGGGFWMDGG
jgi:zinc resistance-associated protein